MAKKKKIGKLFWIIITSIAILGLIWSIASPTKFQEQRTIWQAHFTKLGILGPIAFVFVHALQVINVTPEMQVGSKKIERTQSTSGIIEIVADKHSSKAI